MKQRVTGHLVTRCFLHLAAVVEGSLKGKIEVKMVFWGVCIQLNEYEKCICAYECGNSGAILAFRQNENRKLRKFDEILQLLRFFVDFFEVGMYNVIHNLVIVGYHALTGIAQGHGSSEKLYNFALNTE